MIIGFEIFSETLLCAEGFRWVLR